MLQRFLLILCLLAITGPLSAMSLKMGRNGPPFTENGIQWQPVHYQESSKNRYLAANLPGEPRTSLSSEGIFLNSNYENAFYQVQVLGDNAPKTIKEAKELLEKTRDLQINKVRKSPQPNCNFAIEYQVKTDQSLIRGCFFGTDSGAYLAVSDGDNLIAKPFFESVKFSQ